MPWRKAAALLSLSSNLARNDTLRLNSKECLYPFDSAANELHAFAGGRAFIGVPEDAPASAGLRVSLRSI